MASFLDKFKVSTAWEGKRHTKDLSCEHVTTSDFMKLAPVYYHNMIPNEKLEVDFRAFSRLASMSVPTFGRANLHVRSFFVPFRVIMPAWNDFITDAVHTFGNGSSAIPSTVRKVTNSDLVAALCNTNFSEAGTSTDYDFEVVDSTSTPFVVNYYKFKNYGRHAFKVLESLGYHVSFEITSTDTTAFSALPLLAAAQIYLDWYWPSQYVGNPAFVGYKAIITRDVQGDTLTSTEIVRLLELFNSVNYDSDYFVSAFDTPNGPSVGLSSSFSIADVSLVDSSQKPSDNVDSNTSATYNTNPNTAYVNLRSLNTQAPITQYALEALHRLSDYLRRHQISGARALDRYLARFGVNLPAEKLNRSVYLGCHTIPMMTGDVMSTSDTHSANGGSRIGDYAGKGYLVGNDGHFEFQTTEYGLFVICSSIVPEVGYVEGIDRHNMHLTRLDFFTPEFDGMGTRAISQAELCLAMDGVQQLEKFQGIFGYTPQYSEYKVGRDFLTGDYRLLTLNKVGDTASAWYLFRMINNKQPIVHSLNFVQGEHDRNQFNRIFYNTSITADHFYLHYFFGVKSTANLLPLYDDYDFHNEDNQQTRVMDVNGVKMN